jgi:hypothetical protein
MLGEGVSHLIVMLEDMVKCKTVELLLKLPYLLVVCRHARVMAIRLPHNLVDNELRVTADVEPLDTELDSDVYVIDEGLILHHIVCRVKMQSNYIEELISLGVDQKDASPTPLRVKESSKYMLQCSRVTGAGDCGVSVHSITKSANAWDLFVICRTYVMSSPISLRTHLAILPW